MESFNNILKSFIVIKEMLADRKIDCENLTNISNLELETIYKTSSIFEITVNADFKIIYYVNSKFKLTDLKKYLQNDQDTDKRILLVIKDKVTTVNSRNIVEGMSIHIEVFSIKELQFNVSRHMYVPKHEIVKEKMR